MLFSTSLSYLFFVFMYSASLFVCTFFPPLFGVFFQVFFRRSLFTYCRSLLSVSSHVCCISFVCLFSFLFLFVAGGMWGIRGGVLAGMQQRAQAWGLWRHKLDDVSVRVHVRMCVCVLDSLMCHDHVCVALCCIQRKCRDAFQAPQTHVFVILSATTHVIPRTR